MVSKFIANGKEFKHSDRHKSNSRAVRLDTYKMSFEKRKGRGLTKDEFGVFRDAYNMGYKEGRGRDLQLKKKIKSFLKNYTLLIFLVISILLEVIIHKSWTGICVWISLTGFIFYWVIRLFFQEFK